MPFWNVIVKRKPLIKKVEMSGARICDQLNMRGHHLLRVEMSAELAADIREWDGVKNVRPKPEPDLPSAYYYDDSHNME